MPRNELQLDIGGLQIGVAEELLDVPDVGTPASPLTHYWEPNHRRASTAQPLIPRRAATGDVSSSSWNCRKGPARSLSLVRHHGQKSAAGK